MSNDITIARPYAKAAFEVAQQHNTMAAWTKLLQTAAWVVAQPDVQDFLLDPRHTREQCYHWLSEICEPVMNAEARNFFKLLADNKRLVLIPEIAVLFETYRIEQEKTVVAEITSVYPLTGAEQQRITEALRIKLQREISPKWQLDKSILGGLVIRADDLVIDSSVRNKLTRLETALTN